MESSQLVKNLRFLMTRRMETTNAVAVSSGIKASTLMRLLDGSSAAPRNSTLQALAIHFGVNPEQLLKADLSAKTVQLVEHKSVSEPISLLNEKEIFQIYFWNEADTTEDKDPFYYRLTNDRTWIPAPPDQKLIDLIKDKSEAPLPPVFAFKIKSYAMAPTFCRGDILYICFTPTEAEINNDGKIVRFSTPKDIKNGDFVLAFGRNNSDDKKTHGYLVVRQFFQDDTSDKNFLLTVNPNWPGERSLICERIIGKIVGLYRKF